MTKGIVIHIACGLLLSFLVDVSPLFAVPALIAWGFWMREFGEIKKKIPGSIWSREKIIAMLKKTFSPISVAQWLPPGIAALILQTTI